MSDGGFKQKLKRFLIWLGVGIVALGIAVGAGFYYGRKGTNDGPTQADPATDAGDTADDPSPDIMSAAPGAPSSPTGTGFQPAAMPGGRFDLDRIELAPPLDSNFPYLALPSGYYWVGHAKSNYDDQRFPFWTENDYVWVEGKFYAARINVSGKNWSERELDQHYATYLTSIGAVPLSAGRAPLEVHNGLVTAELRDRFKHGLCENEANDPAELHRTWVIRRPDRSIWMRACGTGRWIIGETEEVPAPANVSLTASSQHAEPSGADIATTRSLGLPDVPMAPPLDRNFPYLTLSSGYYWVGHARSNYGFERFPFWSGDRWIWVEGKFFAARVNVRGKSWSDLEVNRGYEQDLAALGAVQISRGGGVDTLDEVVQEYDLTIDTAYLRNQFKHGLCKDDRTDVRTWVIRRPDRSIWFRACGTGKWIIGETESVPTLAAGPIEQEAAPEPEPQADVRSAEELAQTLSETGKVDVPGIFFEFDSDQVLPTSANALEQMAALMNNTDFQVVIAGHTDDQGGHDYNMGLSDRRAHAVRKTLIDDHGIDGGRMDARGFGLTEPVASNDTEEGRAQNRRVELVMR